MSELIVTVSINNQHDRFLKSILSVLDLEYRVVLERNNGTWCQVNIHSVSHCQLLHVIISINDFAVICHVDPLALGEVALEGRLAIGGVQDWRDLEFAGKHEGLARLASPGLGLVGDLEMELEWVEAGTSVDCSFKQASVHESQVLHPIMHGLKHLNLELVEQKWLSSWTIG